MSGSGSAATPRGEGTEPMANSRSTRVNLTDHELIVLDGACSESVQDEVEAARARLEAASLYSHLHPELAAFVADVVTEARSEGQLVFWASPTRSCSLGCGKKRSYWPYKSGPRRGKPNESRPRTYSGYEFARRFITMQHHLTLGGCKDCIEDALPTIREALVGVRAEVPQALRAPGAPVFARYGRRRCPECGWLGHEGEMGRLPVMMGGGTYPGICPSCGWKSLPLGRIFEIETGFEIMQVEA